MTGTHILKKITMLCIIASTVILAGCGSSTSNIVTVKKYSFSLPTTFQTIPSSRLDSNQIENHIIAAWRNTEAGNTQSLILSESALPATISLQQFTNDTQARLSQNMIGYTQGKITETSFQCNGKKVPAYRHTFKQTDIKDKNTIIQHFDQLYYRTENNVYILSLAHQSENSIFSRIVSSYGCTQS